MALVCPNKSSQEWQNLVSKVGTVEAYRVYNRNNYEIPDFAFTNDDEVESYIKQFPEVTLRNGTLYIKAGKSMEEYHTNISSVAAKIDKINKVYHNLLVINSLEIPQTERKVTSPYSIGRTRAHYVDILPQSLVDHYKVYEEGEVVPQVAEEKEPEVNPHWQQLFEDIFESSQEDTSTKRVLQRFISKEYINRNSPYYHIAKNLMSINFGVKFVDDVTAEYKKRHPDTEIKEVYAFFSTKDNAVILDLNWIAKKDNDKFIRAILHELVHGYTLSSYKLNDRFASKIDSLFNEAKELAGESMLYGYKNPKEFMAEIFTNPGFAQHVWGLDRGKTFLQRVFDIIVKYLFPFWKRETRGREIYKQTVETVTDLIIDLNKFEKERETGVPIENQMGPDLDEVLPTITEEDLSEEKRKEDEAFSKKIRSEFGITEERSKVEEIYENAIKALETKTRIYRGRNRAAYKEEIVMKLISDMKAYDGNPVEALKLFQDFVYEHIKRIEIQMADSERMKKEGNPDAYTIDQLRTWSDYTTGFNSIEELAHFAEGLEATFSDDPRIKDIRKVLDNHKLNRIVSAFGKIKEVYIEEGRKLIARYLTPHSRRIVAKYKEEMERRWNKLSREEKAQTTRRDYIERELGIRVDQIEEETEKALFEQLKIAEDDIGVLRRWLGSLPDSRDMVVSAVADAFIEADIRARKQILPLKAKMTELLRGLEKVSPKGKGFFGDIRDVYDYMLERDWRGKHTGYIKDIYKSDMWREHNEIRDKAVRQGKSYEEVTELLNQWRSENLNLDYSDNSPYSKAKSRFVQELYRKKLVSKEQRDRLINLKARERFEDILDDENVIEALVEWRKENVRFYSKPKEKWINDQFNDLVKLAIGNQNIAVENWSAEERIKAVKENKSKDPRIAFYNFIRENLDKYLSRVPYNNKIFERLPGILKGTHERIKSKDTGAGDVIRYGLANTFSVMADEDTRGTETITDEEGREVHFIPVYYSSDLKNKYEREYATYSEDRVKAIQESYREEYERLPIEKRVDMSLSQYARRTYIDDSAVNDQSFDLASIYFRYFMSAIEYSEKKEILPAMEIAKDLVNERDYRITNWRGKPKPPDRLGRERTKPGNKAELPKQLNQIFDALMYGITEKDQGKIFGIFDVNKTVNAVNRFTSLNLLGLNFIQGFANVALGKTMQIFEAFAGRHYDMKDLAKANVYYWKNMPGIVGDIGRRYPENIVSLALQEFDILNEYHGDEFRKSTKFRQLLNSTTIMFTTHAGEHEMQTKVLLAMLNKIQAKDKAGNDLGTMLNVMKKRNGKLVFEGKNGEEVVNFGHEERARLEREARYILSQMHGEYSRIGQPAAQREALGKLGLMFRKFVVPGWDRRWSRKHINNRIGDYVEGNYVTAGRFLLNFMKDLKNLRWAIASENWNRLTHYEKTNIRKAVVESAFLIATLIFANMILKKRADDEDDEWLTSFFAYQTLRYRAELWFFLNPSEAMKILRSPAAMMSMLENTIKLSSQIFYPMFSGEWQFERYERGLWKGQMKINKTLVDFIPAYKQIYRLRDVDTLISWFR